MASMLNQKRMPINPPVDLGCGIVVDEAVAEIATRMVLVEGEDERSPLFTVPTSKETKREILQLVFGGGKPTKSHTGEPRIQIDGVMAGLIRKDNGHYTVVTLQSLRKPEILSAKVMN